MVYGALPMVLKFLWPFFVLLKLFFFYDLPFFTFYYTEYWLGGR